MNQHKKAGPAFIKSLSHDGRGISTINNKTTFIRGALPNEEVTYTLSRQHSHFNEAEIADLVQPSPERVNPPCNHFQICGGCSLQHMSISKQLKLKQQTLLDQLAHFGNAEPHEILPPLTGDSLGYRRKARLGVKFVIKKNKLLIGFREKASRYLADINDCPILYPAIGNQLTSLSELIASLKIYRAIPQVEVAVGDTQVALVFRHLQTLSEEDQHKLIEYGQHHQFDIYLQPNSPQPVHKLFPADGNDQLTYTLPDQQLTFSFHPLDFTQINLQVNRLMVNQALAELDLHPHEKVLDLFCGIGNFTLPIARKVANVVGVEGNKEMVTRAEKNAKHNAILNANFYSANLADLSTESASPWLTHYDKVLLDPPRVGAKALLPYFPLFAAKKIIYISCNPATLARDAGEIIHLGYSLDKAGIINMFPHTSHIEAMAVFKKN